MKIAITGHTEGIGKYLVGTLPADGFSRSNGYNIETPSNLLSIVTGYDVFINNTYHPTAQEKLFTEIFKKWKYQEKHIINVLNLNTLILPPNRFSSNEYLSSKYKFYETICKYYSEHIDKKVKVTNLFYGTLEQNPNYPGKSKVTNKSVLEVFKYILDQPHNIEHQFLSIGNTTEYIKTKTIL